MFPKTVNCDECGGPFQAFSDTVSTCPSCMIRPSKLAPVSPEIKNEIKNYVKNDVKNDVKKLTKEASMPHDCGEKTCIDCKGLYRATSNGQKRCPDCMAKHRANSAAFSKTKPPKIPKIADEPVRVASAELTTPCGSTRKITYPEMPNYASVSIEIGTIKILITR